MLVFLNERKKFVKRCNAWVWLVAMPLQIGSLPENFPDTLTLNKGGPCDWVFNLLVWLSPGGVNLKNLNTLLLNTKGKIEFISDVQ
jgi:hypothetical protein